MNDANNRQGALLVLLGALCFSTSGTVQALAPPESTPCVIGAVRLLGGGLLLLLWLALTGKSGDVFGGKPWAATPLCLAAGGLLAFQILFFSAVARIGVAVGTVTAIGVSPVCAGLLSRVMLGEKPARRWYPATALALAGLAVLGGIGQAGSELPDASADPAGMLMALCAGACYAVFQISGKRLVMTRGPEAVMTAVSCIGGCCMLPALILYPDCWPIGWLWESVGGAIVALYLALVTSALAFSLYLAGLRSTPAALGATLGLAEPLGAALLGLCFLREPVTARTLAGLMLLFTAMIALLLPQRE